MGKLRILVIAVLFFGLSISAAFAHCQIPCGIYGDQMRADLLAEHITTIETSMNMIQGLSAAKDKDFNQITRWVNNKDMHAQYIQDIVSEYFLTQRIKTVSKEDAKAYDKYLEQLTLLHRMLVLAMKAKQTVDLKYVEELKQVLTQFNDLYFHE
jgi:nickel superoxide dismutase